MNPGLTTDVQTISRVHYLRFNVDPSNPYPGQDKNYI